MPKAVGFNARPEFDLVGGKVDEVGGHVLARRRVHAGCAVFRIEAVNFVGDVIPEVLVLEPFHPRFQPPDLPGIGRSLLCALAVQFPADFFHVRKQFLFRRVVFRADRRRSLEHHVLQEMGRAALPRGFIDGAHPVADVQGNGRAEFALHHQNGQAVLQPGLHDFFLQVHRLRRQGNAREQQQPEGDPDFILCPHGPPQKSNFPGKNENMRRECRRCKTK